MESWTVGDPSCERFEGRWGACAEGKEERQVHESERGKALESARTDSCAVDSLIQKHSAAAAGDRRSLSCRRGVCFLELLAHVGSHSGKDDGVRYDDGGGGGGGGGDNDEEGMSHLHALHARRACRCCILHADNLTERVRAAQLQLRKIREHALLVSDAFSLSSVAMRSACTWLRCSCSERKASSFEALRTAVSHVCWRRGKRILPCQRDAAHVLSFYLKHSKFFRLRTSALNTFALRLRPIALHILFGIDLRLHILHLLLQILYQNRVVMMHGRNLICPGSREIGQGTL